MPSLTNDLNSFKVSRPFGSSSMLQITGKLMLRGRVVGGSFSVFLVDHFLNIKYYIICIKYNQFTKKTMPELLSFGEVDKVLLFFLLFFWFAINRRL